MDSDPATGTDSSDLTRAVKQARRGFRRDVAHLLETLASAELLIPLAAPIEGAVPGEQTPIEGELRLVPHFLAHPEGAHFASVFTRAELLDAMGERLGWTTAGEELEFCRVPGVIALEMARGTIDGETVQGLVVDAGFDSELFLSGAELDSLISGRAIPLVGYVAAIPDDDAETLVAEPGDPPPAELTAALERCCAEIDGLARYELLRTYNPERDLEPHPTLKLYGSRPDIDHRQVAEQVFQAIGKSLPPPGYVDIVFADVGG